MSRVKKVLGVLLGFGLLLVAHGFAQGIFYTQAGQMLEVRLRFNLPPDFALQKRTRFWLEHPFMRGKIIELEPKGQSWPQDPTHYLERLEPLVWKIQVPASTQPGSYPFKVRALVFACNKTLGVCQKHELKASGQIVIGKAGPDRVIQLGLPTTAF